MKRLRSSPVTRSVEDKFLHSGRFFVHQRDPCSSTKESAILRLVFFLYAPRRPRAVARGCTRIAPWLIFRHNFRVQPVKNARPWHACIKGTSMYMHITLHMVTRAAVRAFQIIRPHVRPTLGWRARGCALVQKRKKRRFYFWQRKPYPHPHPEFFCVQHTEI